MKSHACLVKLGLSTDAVEAARLLKAYVSGCSSDALAYAQRLFDEVLFKDNVLWTSLIAAYAKLEQPIQALRLFSQMHLQSQAKPNHFTFATVARACGSLQHLRLGQVVHACAIRNGFVPNAVVETSILDMYSKCSAIECSIKVFDEMPQRNVISWNAMMSGYTNNRMWVSALELFYLMRYDQLEMPDEFAVATAFSACAGSKDLALGRQIHALAMRSGLVLDSAIANTIANFYFKCGEVECAEASLNGMDDDAMSKIIKIKGYVSSGRYQKAIKIIGYNFAEIISMDRSAVIPVLTVCADFSLLRIGRQIHGFFITDMNYQDCHSDGEAAVVIGTTLIDMYSKCSCIEEAQRVFHKLPIQHVTQWNAMLAGYINNDLIDRAVGCFHEMPVRDVISWTTMISGCVRYGLPYEGLKLLAKMYHENERTEGNCFTLSAALNACSLLAVLNSGKQIHAKVIRTIMDADNNSVELKTALVDMYAKSGDLNYAQIVFDRMGEKNVISWTSMIMGQAIHGHGSRALEIFQHMLNAGVEPNEVTFIVVLSACRHCGLVEEAMHYFRMMTKYQIVQQSDHYACMVDLFGRAGKLTEALGLIKETEYGSSNNADGGALLGALLGGCQLHGDVEMGSEVAAKMLDRKQQVSETYVALSNVYASAGMWDKVLKVRDEWKSQGITKETTNVTFVNRGNQGLNGRHRSLEDEAMEGMEASKMEGGIKEEELPWLLFLMLISPLPPSKALTQISRVSPRGGAEMGRNTHLPLIASLFLLFLPSALAEIKTLTITADSRPMILIEKFGFTHTGHVAISISNVIYDSSNPTLLAPLPSLFGFFLLSQESLLRVIQESQQNSHFCVLSSHYVISLFTFQDLSPNSNSFDHSYPVTDPNEYSLFFANCAPESQVTMSLRTEMYNLDPSAGASGTVKDYLPAGQTQLPFLYFSFFIAYVVFLVVWIPVCLRNKRSVHRIHLLMGLLILIKALNLLCAAEDYHYTKVTGTPHGWDVLFYIFQFIRVTLLFTVIVLIGTGWSFLKPFLQEREKKVLMIVIPLQVVANIASAVIGETGPFIKDWVTWNQVFLLVDIACCCAIIFPIVWSIRSLRETSKTDGKAARNLAKLTLFRQFYIVVVGYLYFTRIVVYALRTIAAYKYQWVSAAAEEGASLAFYLFIFYMFQPVEKNEYFAIDDDEEEAAQQALRDDEFEL
ncbi:hypothetical protein ACLOJK_001639 [Asimina triloba]